MTLNLLVIYFCLGLILWIVCTSLVEPEDWREWLQSITVVFFWPIFLAVIIVSFFKRKL